MVDLSLDQTTMFNVTSTLVDQLDSISHERHDAVLASVEDIQLLEGGA